MDIASPAFEAYQQIPKKYTCDGEDLSPPLRIKDVPQGSKSLVLIVDDPDAPRGLFVHWLAWNIDPAAQLGEGDQLPEQGRNDFGEVDYRGPCPPKGNAHRYFFKLYALDIKLTLPPGSSKAELEKAMEGHILGEASLVGYYQRAS